MLASRYHTPEHNSVESFSNRKESDSIAFAHGPTISVIIVNHNGVKVLPEVLDSLRLQTFQDFETIVVDNGSVDPSVGLIREKFKWVRLVRNSRNVGFAGGLNEGVSLSSGKYLMMLNNDVILDNVVLEKLRNSLEADPTVAIVQPKIKSQSNRRIFDYAGAAGGQIDLLGYPFCRGRIFETLEEDLGQYDRACYIFWAGGAAFMVRREILDRIGLLDTRFGMYHEETDLCWRVNLAGFKVAYNPAASVYHLGSHTFKILGDELRFFYMHRNNFHLLFKYYSLRLLILVIPSRFLFELINLFYSLAKGRPTEARSIIRSFASLVRSKAIVLSEIRTRRTRLSANSKCVRIYPRFIVMEYFLLGKHTYPELFNGKAGKMGFD